MDVWKTFLGPFGVYQKDLACRGETRPGGSQPQTEERKGKGKGKGKGEGETRPGVSQPQPEEREG